jgi:hypothetical protein
MSDEVVRALRRIREEYAARFDYDLNAIYRHLKEKERQSGGRYVNLVRNRRKPAKVQVRKG